MPKLGLIAGSGRFPLFIVDAARNQGWEVVAFLIDGEADETDFNGKACKSYKMQLGRLGEFIDTFHKEGINDVVMAGKVHKHMLYGRIEPDARAIKLLLKMKDRSDDTILGAITKELESEGVELHPSAFCLKELLAPEGVLVGNAPSEKQWKDIRYGWKIAKEIGRIDVGQTVVVKGQAVMAIEAIEGTDETIGRGGRLAHEGAAVIKVAKPQQDTRFDMPAIGVNTIASMKEVKADLLAIEAGWTVILDREQTFARASEAGVTIISCVNPFQETGGAN